jgi:hypothetical protein
VTELFWFCEPRQKKRRVFESEEGGVDMCRKLLCLVALLSIVSVASGQTTLIDDFESYWGTPAMLTPVGPWYDGSPAGATSNIQLMIGGGAAQGNQHQWWDYTVDGGWADPANPTNYDIAVDHAFSTITLAAPYDITSKTRIHFSLRQPLGANRTNFYLIEYIGDAWGQTWMPANDHGVQWWMDPATVPGIVLDEGEIFPDWGGQYAAGYQAHPGTVRANEGWVDLTIDCSLMFVPWSDQVILDSDLGAIDALTGFHFGAWTEQIADSSGQSGDFKMDGTNVVWPIGPMSGSLEIDNIWFEEIPEPMTIGLLGLGALALIRRKR